MNNGLTIGILQAAINIPIGMLLAIFHKPIGTKMSKSGKNMHLDKIYGKKLYEENNAGKFILIVGMWLIAWGIIAIFLFPLLTGNNS